MPGTKHTVIRATKGVMRPLPSRDACLVRGAEHVVMGAEGRQSGSPKQREGSSARAESGDHPRGDIQVGFKGRELEEKGRRHPSLRGTDEHKGQHIAQPGRRAYTRGA